MGYKTLFLGVLAGIFLEFTIALYIYMKLFSVIILGSSVLLFLKGLQLASKNPRRHSSAGSSTSLLRRGSWVRVPVASRGDTVFFLTDALTGGLVLRYQY